MAKPRPVPSDFSGISKTIEGLENALLLFGGNPGPLSLTSTRTWPSITRANFDSPAARA